MESLEFYKGLAILFGGFSAFLSISFGLRLLGERGSESTVVAKGMEPAPSTQAKPVPNEEKRMKDTANGRIQLRLLGLRLDL